MYISTIGSNKDFSPVLESARTKERAAEQRAITEKFIKSLPGYNGSNSGEIKIQNIASDLERVSQTFNKRLKFVIDHQSNEVIVKVIDKFTDKVIKILPPEELQRLYRKLKETIGFLFNEMV